MEWTTSSPGSITRVILRGWLSARPCSNMSCGAPGNCVRGCVSSQKKRRPLKRTCPGETTVPKILQPLRLRPNHDEGGAVRQPSNHFTRLEETVQQFTLPLPRQRHIPVEQLHRAIREFHFSQISENGRVHQLAAENAVPAKSRVVGREAPSFVY